MEWDDREDFLKRRGETKGVHLRNLTQVINSCGVTLIFQCGRRRMVMERGQVKWTGPR